MLTQNKEFLQAVVRVCIEGKEKRSVIPVGVSNRHIHLNQEDMDVLFGKGSEITFYKPLSQKGYFAAKETVVVAGAKGEIKKVRILGPLRKHTQVELLRSDERVLGTKLENRHSGQLNETEPVTIIGPCGTVVNSTGVMVALRHIHMDYADAALFGLKDGDTVKVRTQGKRSLEFDNVLIRLGAFETELHLDTDEANAANLRNGDKATIILK
jgi:putative phosphotransacetylase